jgi:hypothetical protein
MQLPACRWGERQNGPEELAHIDGVAVLEFDGLDVHVKGTPRDASSLYLVVDGRIVNEVALRVGDGFVITDGSRRHAAYHIWKASDEQIMLKAREMLDQSATGEGVRTTQRLVTVRPYNLEDTD